MQISLFDLNTRVKMELARIQQRRPSPPSSGITPIIYGNYPYGPIYDGMFLDAIIAGKIEVRHFDEAPELN